MKIKKALVVLPLVATMATAAAEETSFTYGGFIKLDAIMSDFNDGTVRGNFFPRDFYVPSVTPIGGESEGAVFDFHARQSRFFFGTETKLEDGDSIKTRIEFDFMVNPIGNERISSSYAPRLRHAFITYKNWLFGQTWSTFQDVGALPEAVDFIGPTDGTTFARQAMIRYSDGGFSVAIENPETTITPNGGGSRIVADDNSLPDIAANYKFALDGGSYVKVSAISRQLSYNDGGAIDDSANGFGVSVSGRMNFGENNLKFMVTNGSGLGRYVALNAANDAVITDTGKLDAIDSTSGFLAWYQSWGDGWRSTFSYSFFDADNDVALTGTGVTDSSNTIRANLFYSPEPKLSFGIEYSVSTRENAAGDEGDMNRLQFAAKYAF